MIGKTFGRAFSTNNKSTLSFALQTYYENAKILDFRSFPNPNNKIVLFCSHASNTLPEGYSWSEKDKHNFVETHWARDIGALDAAIYIASGLKCALVHTLYSRLLVDANRDASDEDIFRVSGDNKEVELNKDLTKEEKAKRIEKYHKPYYDAINEVSQKINPDIVFGIHSFTAKKENEIREMEVGVEFTESEELAKKICQGMRNRKYDARLNEPYSGDLGYALYKALLEKHDKSRQGAIFEFRNDILLDSLRAPRLKQDAYEELKKACDEIL